MKELNIPRFETCFFLEGGLEVHVPGQGTPRVEQPTYNADQLKISGKHLSFLHDPHFLSAYQRGMQSGHHIWRSAGSDDDIHIEYRAYICCWAAEMASKLPGDFVECGVNTGIYSLTVCEYLNFNALGKRFFLFDTFSGIPESQRLPTESLELIRHQNQFYSECYEVARQNFAAYPSAVLVRGIVPDTLPSVDIGEVAYLSIDMNLTYPELEALKHFWPKLVPGGLVVLDDYAWHGHDEQRRALGEFAASVGHPILTLPTGQGLLIKSR